MQNFGLLWITMPRGIGEDVEDEVNALLKGRADLFGVEFHIYL